MNSTFAIPETLLAQFDQGYPENRGSTPYILMSAALIEHNYRTFCEMVAVDDLYFPVKTNNVPEVLKTLRTLGSKFEVASAAELDLLLGIGAAGDEIIVSNPVKMPAHLDRARDAGVRTFAFDTASELDKLHRHAPGSEVYLRLDVSNEGAEWQLRNKFGAAASEAVPLFRRAQQLGLRPTGLAFHVGWNNTHLDSWSQAIRGAVQVAEQCLQEGVALQSVNLGGGFPAHGVAQYDYLHQIAEVLHPHVLRLKQVLGLKVYAEPGSFIAANAGVLVSTVVDVVDRRGRVWVYLDSGINQGFYWAYAGIRYQLSAALPRSQRTMDCVVTGPTCDSADVFGDAVPLPADLRPGDVVHIFPAGAYVSSAREYNGFGYPEVLVR